jgi:hypothetical protein
VDHWEAEMDAKRMSTLAFSLGLRGIEIGGGCLIRWKTLEDVNRQMQL